MTHYTYPRPEAYNLNKLMYDLKREPELRTRYLADPDALLAEREVPAEQAEAFKALDQERLAGLGAHRLLVFLAKLFLDMDREKQRFTMQKQ